jgi:uncharacterized protein with beta-barrel porin domain
MVQTLTANGTYAFNALALAAAQANDAAFARLQPVCDSAATAATSCTGKTLLLFNQLRNLEDNADELLGRGPQQYSLRLPPSGMAAALQWTAPEEYAAQGSMTTKFANNQASVLSNRFAALRFASHGILTAQAGSADPFDSAWSFADDSAPRGGSAGADSADFGRWSIFANGGYGAGNKDPTVFEDAFNFDNTVISIGGDVRLNQNLVVGVLAGHSEQRIDFNSALSIVDGDVRGNGQSFLAYLQLEGDAAYLNFSIGAQHLSIDTRRKITYPSNNPAIPPVDETAYSNTGSTTWIATLGGGYTFHYRAFAMEPYLNLQSLNTKISAFTEYNSNGFDVAVNSQSIESLEGAVGLKLEYVLSGGFGVLVPYVYGEARHQFRDESRQIDSGYATSVAGTDFLLPTDSPTTHYYVVGGGGSVVLKHGLQGFLQYYRVLDYTNYTDHVVSGGIRWEF